ncbi:hypothetical protein B0J18DRAFT_43296 [Chaetomium sp. MPI-SDFR-AT-0129]|nr:hypothetical protein B0J18DRAFT_43296 [Chaetomium sp. MPI-SDFR-AT-0129]
MGNSRGVGFARFETRDECEDVIKKYHGASIGDEGMLMQVRYADTPAQKELKRITAERRQFRTNEYNIGAYGTADVGIHPSIYSPAPWNRRAAVGPDGIFAPRVPSIRTSIIGSSASMGSMVGQALAQTPKYVRRPCSDLSIHPDIRCRQSLSVRGTSSSDDGLGDSATVVDSPTVKRGSTQSSPTAKTEKA